MTPSETPSAYLLIVDDDVGIREVLLEFFGRHGFGVDAVASGEEMDQVMAARRPDLIVLDSMLPGEDGLAICRRLSGSGQPVIMLSAVGEETDRIVGLELGADDYIAKPCNPRELLARVKAVLRRRAEWSGDAPLAYVEFAGWRLDSLRRALRSPEGDQVQLSSGEFSLLQVFVERPERVLTRDQLLDLARGSDADTFDRAIDVQISRLRKKLEDGSGMPIIQTVRGEGYRFACKVRRV